jgi:hypothetical protein
MMAIFQSGRIEEVAYAFHVEKRGCALGGEIGDAKMLVPSGASFVTSKTLVPVWSVDEVLYPHWCWKCG